MRQPNGLLGLLLDGALSDSELYIRTQWRDRISTLPSVTQKLLRSCIEKEDFSSSLFKELNDSIGKHFTCRVIPSVDCMDASFAGMNNAIYSKMQGDCEFMIGGVLKNWSVTDRLNLFSLIELLFSLPYLCYVTFFSISFLFLWNLAKIAFSAMSSSGIGW